MRFELNFSFRSIFTLCLLVWSPLCLAERLQSELDRIIQNEILFQELDPQMIKEWDALRDGRREWSEAKVNLDQINSIIRNYTAYDEKKQTALIQKLRKTALEHVVARRESLLRDFVEEFGQYLEKNKLIEDNSKRLSLIRFLDGIYEDIASLSRTINKKETDYLSKEAIANYELLSGNFDWKPSRRAEICKPVDLKKKLDRSNRNQDTVGWCFAYAAADIISSRIGVKVSALGVAASYYRKSMKEGNLLHEIIEGKGKGEGGDILHAILAALNDDHGLCLEKDLSSEDFYYSERSRNPIEMKEALKTVQKIYTLYQGANGILGKIKADMSCRVKSSWELLQSMFINLTEKDMIQIFIDSDTSQHSFDRLIKSTCRTHPKETGKNLKFGVLTKIGGVRAIRGALDEDLDQKNIVGIEYNSSVLLDHDSMDMGLHASTVVGRRYNETTQTCEYEIRNSWGNGCGLYDKYYQCDSGNIWVPDFILFRSMNSLLISGKGYQKYFKEI